MKTWFVTVFFLVAFCSLAAFGKSFLDDGNAMYAQGEYAAAVHAYRKGLLAGENPALLRFNLGNTYYSMDKPAQAIVNYQNAIAAAPEFFRARMNLGILYFNLLDYASAIATLEQAKRLEPANTKVLIVLAACYHKLGAFGPATRLLETALTQDATVDDAYFLLFDIARELQDYTSAVHWLEAYPDKGSRVADKYQLLADYVSERAGPQAAAPYFRKLIEVSPNNQWAHYAFVNNQASCGNVYSALEHALLATRMFPEFSALPLMAGAIAFDAQLYRKAETFFTLALAGSETDGLVGLQNIKKMYEALNDRDGIARVNELILRSN